MRASKESRKPILPESSAIASVSALKVEPISNTPVVSRLTQFGLATFPRARQDELVGGRAIRTVARAPTGAQSARSRRTLLEIEQVEQLTLIACLPTHHGKPSPPRISNRRNHCSPKIASPFQHIDLSATSGIPRSVLRDLARHSALMLAARITLPHFSVSST